MRFATKAQTASEAEEQQRARAPDHTSHWNIGRDRNEIRPTAIRVDSNVIWSGAAWCDSLLGAIEGL